MGDLYAMIWETDAKAPTVHARLWPGVERALCTGAVTAAADMSIEAPTDEDADVTCAECLRVAREARKESHA